MLELSDWRDLMIQECIIQVAAAFVGTIAFSVLFSVARRHYLSCGLVGAIGWLIYYIFHYLTDSTVFSIFLASIGVAFVSRFSAAKYKTLTPIFLIPGLFPLVPGSGIFYTAYYLFMGNRRADRLLWFSDTKDGNRNRSRNRYYLFHAGPFLWLEAGFQSLVRREAP